MNTEQIAKVVHEANRAYCQSIGDFSQPTWEDAPEAFKASSVSGVEFRLNNPDATSEAQHNEWVSSRVGAGWVYGDVTDKPNKIHNCLVPYEQLPIEQQKKDALFAAIVNALK